MKSFYQRSGLWAGLGMLILILDSRTAVAAAREGVQTVIETVIPSLFPFFFLSVWLTGTAVPSGGKKSGILARIFPISADLGYLLVPAFLGGYPAGAQAVSSLWRRGCTSRATAERLLCFCSNAGPSFLFGIVAAMFPKYGIIWVIWFFHILGAITAALLFCPQSFGGHGSVDASPMPIPEVLRTSLKVMSTVCAWVILFKVLLTFLERWFFWLFPDPCRVFLCGILELTNGCCSLMQISDIRLRLVLCSAMLSAGGLCVTLQTRSVTEGLSLRYYFFGKLVQTLVSTCLSYALMFRKPLPAVLTATVLTVSIMKKQKRSSIPLPTGV